MQGGGGGGNVAGSNLAGTLAAGNIVHLDVVEVAIAERAIAIEDDILSVVAARGQRHFKQFPCVGGGRSDCTHLGNGVYVFGVGHNTHLEYVIASGETRGKAYLQAVHVVANARQGKVGIGGG